MAKSIAKKVAKVAKSAAYKQFEQVIADYAEKNPEKFAKKKQQLMAKLKSL